MELFVHYIFLKAFSLGIVEPNMLKVAEIRTMFVPNFSHVKIFETEKNCKKFPSLEMKSSLNWILADKMHHLLGHKFGCKQGPKR